MNVLYTGYIAIIVGALSNIASVYMMKKAHGFSRLVPSVLAILFIVLTQFLASYAMHTSLPMGFVIATITLLIMLGTAVQGILFLGETISRQRWLGLSIALAGIVIASL